MSELLALIIITDKGAILKRQFESQLWFKDILYCCHYLCNEENKLSIDEPVENFKILRKIEVRKYGNSFNWNINPMCGNDCLSKPTLFDTVVNLLLNQLRWVEISEDSKNILDSYGIREKTEEKQKLIYKSILRIEPLI